MSHSHRTGQVESPGLEASRCRGQAGRHSNSWHSPVLWGGATWVACEERVLVLAVRITALKCFGLPPELMTSQPEATPDPIHTASYSGSVGWARQFWVKEVRSRTQNGGIVCPGMG